MAGRHKNGFSIGSILMIFLTVLVLVSSVLMLLRFASGHSIDFSKLHLSSVTDGVRATDNPSETSFP